jgi:hypothetical protein
MNIGIGTFICSFALMILGVFVGSRLDIEAMLIVTPICAGVFCAAHFLHTRLEHYTAVKSFMESLRFSTGFGTVWIWIAWFVF